MPSSAPINIMLRTFGKHWRYSGVASPSELHRPPSKISLMRLVDTSTIVLQISAAILGSPHFTEILIISVSLTIEVVSL